MVYGTRPEAIKLSKVAEALRALDSPPTIVCTGQHTDLLRGTPAEDVMRPDVSLNLPSANDPLAYAGLVSGALRAKWAKSPPWVVVVQGDTASAFAGAMAACALKIPIAHVEAGIRSGDRDDPWPEEGFRQTIDAESQFLYCPTPHTFTNILTGTSQQKVVTGNPGIDALYTHTQPLEHPRKVQDRVLVTLHRRESFGEPLHQVVTGLAQAAQRYPSLEFVWPVHPNPRVQDAIPHFSWLPPNLMILPPLATVPFARILAASRCVITDSGGVQEEAAALGVPCLVAREKTDRPESVEIGLAKVIGRTSQGVLDGLDWALGFHARCTPSDCFGDGKSAPRIAQHLLSR